MDDVTELLMLKTRPTRDNFSFAYLYGLIAVLPGMQGGSKSYGDTVAEIRRQCEVIGITPESGMGLLELMKAVRAEEVRRSEG